jgi:hypothetical protein
MKRICFFSAILLLLLSACSSPKNTTDKKNGGKTYGNLFIIANTADIEVRVRLEKELAAEATSKGYKAVKSIDIMPPVLSDPKPPTKEELADKIQTSGCDALCVIYFLKNGEEVKYNAGINFKGTNPWLSSLVGMFLEKNEEYYKHHNNFSDDPKYTKSVSQPGSYTKGKDFYLLSELYDAASAQNIYSESSDSFNDADLVPFSTNFLTGLLKHLELEKLLMK